LARVPPRESSIEIAPVHLTLDNFIDGIARMPAISQEAAPGGYRALA
jgi:hypothetical protein